MRHCFSQWLKDTAREANVFAVASPAELFDNTRAAKEAHLIVYSIASARVGDPQVLGTIKRLGEALPNIPILLLSDRDDVEEVAQAIRQGVRGYVPTTLELSELAAAIHCVQAGGTFVPANTLMRFVLHQRTAATSGVDRSLLAALTPREMEIVARLRQGKPNKVIAYELDISESTVKAFVRRILIKLNALNRTEVVHRTEGLFSDFQSALDAPRARVVAT